MKGSERVFVDNRPEAFPARFFTDLYLKVRSDESLWQQIQAQYGLNVIWLYRNEMTHVANRFMARRMRDPQWALVFLDDYSVIYVRRQSANLALIRGYEIKDIDRLELPAEDLDTTVGRTETQTSPLD